MQCETCEEGAIAGCTIERFFSDTKRIVTTYDTYNQRVQYKLESLHSVQQARFSDNSLLTLKKKCLRE